MTFDQQQAQEALKRLQEHLMKISEHRRLKVLLIEDNDNDAEIIEREFPCVDLTRCKDLESAVDITIHETFDVVLLDLFLTPGSGYDWIHRTVNYRDKDTSIIAITGMDAETEVAKEVLTMGCDAVLCKGPETYSMLRALFKCKSEKTK